MVNLSIVIPIFNVEAYLERCVKSILNQCEGESEIILINDGSTDSSGEICDNFRNLYPERIKVLHKKNGGLSSARNAGLDLAIGKYIFFLDSDDFIINDTLGRLLSAGMKYDAQIVVGKAVRYYSDGKTHKKATYKTPVGLYSGIEFWNKNFIKNEDVTFCAQFNLYQRQFLETNNLRFKEGVLHEDELWTPTVFLKANRVFFTDVLFYNHYFRIGSITQSKNKEKNATDIIIICNELDKLLKTYKHNEIKYFKDRIAMLYMHAVNIGKLYNKTYKFSLDRKFPLKNSSRMRTTFKAIIFYLSPMLYCKLNNFLKNRGGKR
ncbi:hypothetical protein C2I17_14710 [Niallia circulans]|uniref:glycosyltransferase n=1 Tax=Niallia circulans TaxID=1397 RepID=UPI00201D7D77|nr:glycosyltransferase [Niallia circulans]UQZ75701.1 hypothetical protein C2I17_14710 [Niallia circulans]